MKAILITYDCLPLRLLGCYGNESAGTPHFDQFAAQSTVFDANFGENFDARATNHAWWTGRYTFALTHQQQRTLPRMDHVLSAAGVEVRMISECPSGDKPVADVLEETESTLQELRQQSRGSWLVWLKLSGLTACPTSHASSGLKNIREEPSNPSAVEIESLRIVDDFFGAVWEKVLRLVEDDNLLVILTAARGADPPDGFSRPCPPTCLYSSVVQLPLLIRVSHGECGSRRRELTQSIDLVPTLLDWFGIDALEIKPDGRSLLPAIRDQTELERASIILGAGRTETAIRTREFYLVENSSGTAASLSRNQALFVKPDDAFDLLDVADQFPDVVETLTGELHGMLNSRPQKNGTGLDKIGGTPRA